MRRCEFIAALGGAVTVNTKRGYEETRACITRSCRCSGPNICLPGGGARPSLARMYDQCCEPSKEGLKIPQLSDLIGKFDDRNPVSAIV